MMDARCAESSAMHPPIRIISSMATRALLAELAADWQRRHGTAVQLESVGGVNAARRVAAGEPFDLVVLASDALAQLAAAGHVQAAHAQDLVRSAVAVAVPAGAPRPDVGTQAALRAAVQGAGRIGYSTGPSGRALLKLIDRWGLAEALQGRLVQAPPGVPVGQLLAQGQVDLGFQQLSELMHLQGITLLGPMPPGCEIDTVFSAATTAAAPDDTVLALLHWLAAPATADTKQRHGMAPA
jgi:molybdate transport system substrate-binding protein